MMNKELDKLVAAFPKRVKFAKMNVGNHPEFGTRQRIRVRLATCLRCAFWHAAC